MRWESTGVKGRKALAIIDRRSIDYLQQREDRVLCFVLVNFFIKFAKLSCCKHKTLEENDFLLTIYVFCIVNFLAMSYITMSPLKWANVAFFFFLNG